MLDEQRTMKNKCIYCGQRSSSDWLICGENQSWGCGASLPRLTTIKATHGRLSIKTQQGPYVTITGPVTNPIIVNDTTGEQLQRMDNAIDDLKTELGCSLLPIFEKILDPVSNIVGILS